MRKDCELVSIFSVIQTSTLDRTAQETRTMQCYAYLGQAMEHETVTVKVTTFSVGMLVRGDSLLRDLDWFDSL